LDDLLLFAALADVRSLFFPCGDAADDERLVDEDELDDDDDDERLEADEELVVPDELEPLELERDARLRFVFDGESLVGFLIVSVSTVILYDKQKISIHLKKTFHLLFSNKLFNGKLPII
jgi:hypothetical protein